MFSFKIKIVGDNMSKIVKYEVDIEEIAEELIRQAEVYEWYSIENDDIQYEIANYVTLDLMEKVRDEIESKIERDEDDGSIKRRSD